MLIQGLRAESFFDKMSFNAKGQQWISTSVAYDEAEHRWFRTGGTGGRIGDIVDVLWDEEENCWIGGESCERECGLNLEACCEARCEAGKVAAKGEAFVRSLFR